MRIIAGRLKGRRLVAPRGPATRPTADHVRTALMDALTPRLAGARVLDLFAGAGGVGLEALSRGAAHATLVERQTRALAALRENVATLGLADETRLVRLDVARALERLDAEGARFEIVYVDPPYEADAVEATLARLGAGRVAAPQGVVVVQHPTKRPPGAEVGRLTAFRTRRFGETTLTFFLAGEYSFER